MQPPPPPPPLNIPPSRARRQLAARLALHSKANAESNGDDQERPKAINPFADNEDDDEDDSDGEDNGFTVGDLEAEVEGKGHLPPASGLQNSDETVDELLGNNTLSTHNVGIPKHFSSQGSNWGVGRGLVPAMWPFGNQACPSSSFAASTRNQHPHDPSPVKQSAVSSVSAGTVRNHVIVGGQARSSFASWSGNANFFDLQNNYDDDSDDSNSSDGHGEGYGSLGSRGHKRRLSSTTEAKRRTSLEDDDDDEVVHVKMDISDVGERTHSPVDINSKSGAVTSADDDGELIDIQHSEMQGVESSEKVVKKL